MPDTMGYMVLGYALTVIILAGLVGYLVLKTRNLHKELAMLEMLAEEDSKEKHKPGDLVRQTVATQEQAVR
jgi:hypothetical protein